MRRHEMTLNRYEGLAIAIALLVVGRVLEGGSIWDAVWIIILADAIMSLDNVLAVAAAAHGDLFLVVFGIGLSLPIVVWGSGLLAVLMNRFAWIIWIGGGILGYVASEMILSDRSLARVIEHVAPGRALLPFLPAVGIVAPARSSSRATV